MLSMLTLVGGGALASVVTPSFPYEKMVMSKLSTMSRTDAAAYLGRHSTRFMLREAGVSDAIVDEARAIVMTNEDVKTMTGSVVPTMTPGPTSVTGAGWGLNPEVDCVTAYHPKSNMGQPRARALPKAMAASVKPPMTMKEVDEMNALIQNGMCPDFIAADAMFLDEASALAAAAFPIDEATLIAKAKAFLFYGQGVERPELLNDDFVFMGPFVGGEGGLPKKDYLKSVGGFNIKKAFPDLNPRFHHFRADPLDAGRIWFTSVASGTDNGEGFLGNAPTGVAFQTPPQACSLKFDPTGRVVKYTIGHVMERSIGNTGGLGGIFGPAYAIGKPLPFREAQPWTPSKRYRVLMQVGKLLTWLQERKEAKA